ncbi:MULTISPECIES: STAS domain-containing protein [unclassified Blastococcus]|uniref:STAS domain-containing protein n=1 Tax=unclassified Blastococcus TaxID=2619396 RepID=UPI001EEFC97D|nr:MULTISPECIES: STAS domain-containing protein [unclassified Blastococcus]
MQSPVRLAAHHVDEPLATQLDVSVDTTRGCITLVGELDRQTARQLLDGARALAAAELGHWVIDARGLHFCDVSGLRAISVTYRRALRHGATMTVVGAGRWLRRALATIRLHHHVFPDAGQAWGSTPADGHGPVASYVQAAYPLAKCYSL